MSELVDSLRNDHRKIEKLLLQVKEAKNGSEREVLLEELSLEFNVHAIAEEQVLYAEMGAHDELRDMALRSVDDHDEARALLERLQGQNPDSQQWVNTVDKLERSIRAHVEQEETEVFPRVERLMSFSKLREVNSELQTTKHNLELAS